MEAWHLKPTEGDFLQKEEEVTHEKPSSTKDTRVDNSPTSTQIPVLLPTEWMAAVAEPVTKYAGT